MAGMEDALKNLMMRKAMAGGGAPTGGSAPMAPGGQGSPMPQAGGGAMPQINPAVLKAVMAARAGGGKAAPKAKASASAKKGGSKAPASAKGKAPSKAAKGKPVPKKKSR